MESQDKLTVNFRKMEALEESIVGTILPVRDRLQEKFKENEKKRARHTRAVADDKATPLRDEPAQAVNSKRQRRSTAPVVADTNVVSASTSTAGEAVGGMQVEGGPVAVKVEDASAIAGTAGHAQEQSPELVGEGSVTVIDACSRAPVVYRSEAKPVSSHGMGVVSQGLLIVDAAGGITREGGMQFYPPEEEQEEVEQNQQGAVLAYGGQTQSQPQPQYTSDALGEGFAINIGASACMAVAQSPLLICFSFAGTDMYDEVSIFDGPVSSGFGSQRNRGPPPETWHKPAGGPVTAPESWPPPDSALSSVSAESGYMGPPAPRQGLTAGLVAQQRMPRTADYCCSICLGSYQVRLLACMLIICSGVSDCAVPGCADVCAGQSLVGGVPARVSALRHRAGAAYRYLGAEQRGRLRSQRRAAVHRRRG